MKGAIWTMNAVEGNEMLKSIVEKYKMMGIEPNRVNYSGISSSFAEFPNGDYWRVCKASDSFRGVRCNIAYIQRSIPYDVYRTVISPSMFDFPFAAIRLWGEGNLHITDEVPLPF